MAHIKENHPSTDAGTRFSICTSLGCLPAMQCCWDKKQDKNGGKQIKITKQVQQIGLGPYLMLMVAKSFAWLFFILSVLNLPVFLFYFEGNVVRNLSNNASRSSFSFQQIFAEFSLGNIGQSQVACGNSNLAIEKEIGVSCAYGKMGQEV